MYCKGGSLKNLCHFEMGGGGLTNADVIRGAGGRQNLADVICERSLRERELQNSCMMVLLAIFLGAVCELDDFKVNFVPFLPIFGISLRLKREVQKFVYL